MAHFYATAKGNRGEVSRTGSMDSGITAYINGWNVGVLVYGYYDKEKKKDYFRIYKTSGSNRQKSDELIATFYEE